MEDLDRRERLRLVVQSWASIAPLIACILGPLSILLGIPALSQRWRGYVVDNQVIETLPDPGLNIILASLSLACEVSANVILMLRFSSIAVPLTTSLSLALWIAKVAICLGNYVQFIVVHPQPRNLERNWIYLEGFWIGCASMVISAIVIVFLILNLAITPTRKDLAVHEKAIVEQHRLAHRGFMVRVLILVLAMGFGSLAFSKLEDFSFVTGLYLVTASILTVGFGDVVMTTTTSKILLFPYLVFSVTYVALMVTSIAGLIDERLDAQRQLREHLDQVTKVSKKQQTFQLKHALGASHLLMLPTTEEGARRMREERYDGSKEQDSNKSPSASYNSEVKGTGKVNQFEIPLSRTLTLQEEIEEQAGSMAKREHRRQIRNIFLALLFFSIFWFVGALVFSFSEGWSYGTAMYFCYVFFMTVGYGDYSAKSQLGRVLFIVYAMIAVPTVTFLVQVFVEAADIRKYIYNSKKSRQQRINELDTRDIDDLKRSQTEEQTGLQLATGSRSRSLSQAGLGARSRTLSRSATIEADRSIVLTQRIQLCAPQSPRTVQTSSGMAPPMASPPQGDELTIDDDDSLDGLDGTDIASQVLATEIETRRRLLQNARKLDHLTRLLISPHLHHEARLLLSLEMGRLDGHYRVLLRQLCVSHAQATTASEVDEREWMEDTKEAEWLGLTGLERERKFVMEYRACFAGLLTAVETLVGDIAPAGPPAVDTVEAGPRDDGPGEHGTPIRRGTASSIRWA